MIQAGAGKKKIMIPEEILPLEKFHKVHDDIHARVLYIKSNEDFVLVSLELTSIREYEIQKLRQIISERLNIREELIWICVTHTFSAPHTRSEKQLLKPEIKRTNDQFCQALEKAVNDALTEALENMQQAKVCCSSGRSDVNINRDKETADGWWHGYDEEGFSDKTVPIVCFKNNQDHPIAILYNYDIQSSIMDNIFNQEGYRCISGDLTGKASQYIEEMLPGCTAVFLLGAAGDQAPRQKALMDALKNENGTDKDRLCEKGFDFIGEAGTQLGKDVLQSVRQNSHEQSIFQIQLSQKTIICKGQVPPADMHDLHATWTYDYQKSGQITTPIDVLTLGDIAFIGVQPELCSITGSEIRKTSPYALTFVATMVNGGAKYMADKKSYERMTYEAMNSSFRKGSAELLRDEIICLLQKTKEK